MPVAGINGSVDEHTDCMEAGYDVGYDSDLVPLMVFASRVGGPLASIRAEAARLPGSEILRDVTKEQGRCTVVRVHWLSGSLHVGHPA